MTDRTYFAPHGGHPPQTDLLTGRAPYGGPGTPPALLQAVFAMAPDGWQVVADDEGALLVHLDAVHAPDQDSDEARALKTGFSQQISQQMALDLQAAFAAELEAQAGITLDQGVINAVNANFP